MIDVSIQTMKLSDGRADHYVQINCDGRTYSVRCYRDQFKNRADYEHDELRHVLLGEPKPDLMNPKYADKPGLSSLEAE